MITEKELGNNIANIFEQILAEKNMNIKEVAENIGINQSAVYDFLSSLREGKGGSLKTFCKYASALKISPYLFFYQIEMIPNQNRENKEEKNENKFRKHE